MSPETFESYLSRLFDNDLSPQEFSELEAHFMSSPKARARYLECVDFQNIIELELSNHPQQQLGSSNIVPIDRIISRQKRRTAMIASFAAAALIMIGVMVMTVLIVPEKQHGLTFDISPSTQFTLTHSSIGDDTPTGMTMEEGSHLVLTQGTVELTFGTGVKSIVMAPADMSLHGDNQLYLNRGTAWFHVPEGAEGFQVTTQNLKVVDLGTEFGVITNTDDQDEVHVFKGTVEVTIVVPQNGAGSLLMI